MRVIFVILGIVVTAGAIGIEWRRSDENGVKWREADRRVSLLSRENKLLTEEVAAQRELVERLRSERPRIDATAIAALSESEVHNGQGVASAPPIAELKRIGDRVEIAPGGPMVPISE